MTKSKKRKFKTDRIIGLSAMSISLMTLIIFIYQTNLIREQNRLSVTPRLSFNESQVENDSVMLLTYEIKNKGLGPGIIDSISILYKGNRYDANYRTFFQENLGELFEKAHINSTTYLTSGTAISADERISLFQITIAKENFDIFLNAREKGDLSHFDLEVYYSSIYQEHWKIQLNSNSAIPESLE